MGAAPTDRHRRRAGDDEPLVHRPSCSSVSGAAGIFSRPFEPRKALDLTDMSVTLAATLLLVRAETP